MSVSAWPDPPAEFVLRGSGAGAVYVAASMEHELSARGLGAWGDWVRTLRAGVASTGRGLTAVVSGESGPRWRLKFMRRGGSLARLWRDRYPSAGRLVATLAASQAASARGVPTTRPIALILAAGWGGLVRGAMAFEELEGAEDLAHRARRHTATAADLVATLGAVRLMHDRGIHHTDLNLGNLLVRPHAGGGPDPFVIDFDRAVVGSKPCGLADRQVALRRLERSCAKITGSPGLFGPGSEDLWYTIYAADDVELAERLAQGRAAGRLALAIHRVGWRRNQP